MTKLPSSAHADLSLESFRLSEALRRLVHKGMCLHTWPWYQRTTKQCTIFRINSYTCFLLKFARKIQFLQRKLLKWTSYLRFLIHEFKLSMGKKTWSIWVNPTIHITDVVPVECKCNILNLSASVQLLFLVYFLNDIGRKGQTAQLKRVLKTLYFPIWIT